MAKDIIVPENFQPLCTQETLMSLEAFYGFHRIANAGTKNARDYIVLQSEKPSITKLDGIEIVATFKEPGAKPVSRIYLEITTDAFKSLIAQNSGSNLFWCKKDGDSTTIVSDAKYAIHHEYYRTGGEVE